METCPSIFVLAKSQNFYKMTTHHTEDRLQHYEFDQYTVTTNFATYEDAVNYANEHQGELVEVGFTDGSDNPTPNDSAKLVESKKPFKVELPDHPNYRVIYSDAEGFQEMADQILFEMKKAENDMLPEDILSDQNIAPGDRIIITDESGVNTVTTRERIKFLMRGNVYELAVKTNHT